MFFNYKIDLWVLFDYSTIVVLAPWLSEVSAVSFVPSRLCGHRNCRKHADRCCIYCNHLNYLSNTCHLVLLLCYMMYKYLYKAARYRPLDTLKQTAGVFSPNLNSFVHLTLKYSCHKIDFWCHLCLNQWTTEADERCLLMIPGIGRRWASRSGPRSNTDLHYTC